MKNNALIAQHLLVAGIGNEMTIADVLEATAVDVAVIRQCMNTWAAAGWLTRVRREGRGVFSVTELGKAELAKLITRLS